MYGIGLFAFILFLSTLLGNPVLPALSKQLGAQNSVIPIILAASLTTVVITQFFTGILADRWSKRKLILIGAILGSISSFMVLIVTQWWQLLALRILAGIADAIAMPALLVITANLGKDQPGKFFGILRGSQGLSFVAGPALGSLFSLVSLRTPFLADGILSMIAFMAAFILISKEEMVSSSHDLSIGKGLKLLFGNRSIYIYLLLGITGMFSYGILANFIPTKSQLLGFTPWQIGMIMSLGALVHSITSFTIGPLSDRYGRKLFAILAQPVIIASAVALIFCDSVAAVLVTYCIFVVGETIPLLLCFVYASETFDSRYMGTSMAVFDSMIDLSLAIGPLIGILVFGISDNIDYPFIVAAVPSVVFLTVSFSLKKGKKGNS